MVTIFAADDSPEDLLLLRRALARCDFPLRFVTVNNGRQAQQILQCMADRELPDKYPLPDLICLDVHMPLRNGLDLLEWIKRQPNLKDIPVLIVSGSDDPEEANKAYELGAIGYFGKPADQPAIAGLLKAMTQTVVG